MPEQNENPAKNLVDKGDALLGDGLALASNEVAPVVGPIITNILWKHKWTIIIGIIVVLFLCAFSFETINLQLTANSRGIIELIPQEHRTCMSEASEEYEVEFELLSAYGKVIADFDETHIGEGIGFLEISEEDWDEFGVVADTDDELITTVTPVPSEEEEPELNYDDICTNYYTLANILSNISGDSEEKIEGYTYPEKQEVLEWYERYSGLMLIPYGNPIGLERSDLMTITSGYNIVRVIYGKRSVHKGVDFVPSTTWLQENPDLSPTDAVNFAIISGEVNNFIDQYGALCTFVTNEKYRTLYCHCDMFLAEDDSYAKYGDPICSMGSTGFSTGLHTHLGLYEKGDDGTWYLIDPTPFILVN